MTNTVAQIDADIREHRRLIFSSQDDNEILAAQQKIRALVYLRSQHPDEIRRRSRVKSASNRRFWFLTR
tara:strand:+ start:1755 stop:1961 length:207 start_codon:yes stop_codon:yes gene_type:complete